MKTSRYSDSQILAILKQAEAGTPVPALCREHEKWTPIFGQPFKCNLPTHAVA